MILTCYSWLFIIEGAATVVFAIATAFIIPDWPSTTKFLSEEERALAVVRLIEDAGEEEEKIKPISALGMAAKDHRVWLCVLGQVCLFRIESDNALMVSQFCVQAVASLTNFLPTVIRNFGFSTINTLLLTAPVRSAHS